MAAGGVHKLFAVAGLKAYEDIMVRLASSPGLRSSLKTAAWPDTSAPLFDVKSHVQDMHHTFRSGFETRVSNATKSMWRHVVVTRRTLQ